MENQNSVAYVGKIGSVSEIPGADNIELVLVGGWQAITKKGEYKVDDLVVVATTDAVIPKELSDQLGVTNYLRKGQRVRTVKLRGVYSECLIVSLNQVFKSNMSAGGFVEEGRVRGILSLSRALGDLEYKLNRKVGVEAQMITCVPEIKKIDMTADDKFLIIACDGIWDCLSS